MDDDLAFCMDRFGDEQMELIDNRIKEIEDEEEEALEKLRHEKRAFNRKKPPVKDKGSHDRDQQLVDRFIQELREYAETPETEKIVDDPHCLDALRAEISTKVGACAGYLHRLRNVARTFPRTAKFAADCDSTIDYCRRNNAFEKNFEQLCKLLQESDESNAVQTTQHWWFNSYGSAISDLNRRNEKLNPVLTEKHYVQLSSTSRAIDHAKRLIKLRKVIWIKPSKDLILQQFVQELYALDPELEKRKRRVDLVEDLLHEDVDQNIAFAQRWLNHRDEIRNQKDVDLYEDKLMEAQAEYGRRKIAQQAKKLALAKLLERLAVGSKHGEKFNAKLKEKIDEQNKNRRDQIVVVSGDIKEPEVNDVPIILHLDKNDANVDQWIAKDDRSKERFAKNLCEAFGIPTNKIQIERIDTGEGVIHLRVVPPYGKDVIDRMNGHAPDAAARMNAVRKCCEDLHVPVKSLTFGELGLEIEEKLMDPRWNRVYPWPDEKVPDGVFWKDPIDRGHRPYYCPSGWKRYGVKVAKDSREFDEKWGTWSIAYHGTRGEYAANILTSGLRVSTQGCFYEEGIPRVYVSPSIEYCAHPRYACPWRKVQNDGKPMWYQLVFQCRVNPDSIDQICPETLINTEAKQMVKVDPNFDNNEIEWIILGKKGTQYVKDDIICYGVMMRVSTIDPALLQTSSWWKHTAGADIYKKGLD